MEINFKDVRAVFGEGKYRVVFELLAVVEFELKTINIVSKNGNYQATYSLDVFTMLSNLDH